MAKKNKKSLSKRRFNTDFWEKQKRKTLIESTGASMRLSGLRVTNEDVEKIINSEKESK